MNDILKAFWEEKTSTLFKTLKDAKKAHKFPYVYRVWLNSKLEIIGKEPVWCYGAQACTVKGADSYIAGKLAAQSKKGGEE
ncbi:MAG: hypothetical protein UH625_09275 [Muribaculaceae bacterium]|nr:hypothetical protein [Muribaculaceae bacterium]